MTASVTSSLANSLLHFHGPLVYILVGILVFGETAFLLGFVIPGETAALVGGALAALHQANLDVMLVLVVVAAIVGDSVGYVVGVYLGPWLLERRLLKGNLGVYKARALLVRFGGPAVFLGRWVALARALVPGLTGMSEMRYRTFLIYNALGGLAWGTTFVLLGWVLGRSYEKAATAATLFSAVVLGLLAAGVVVYVVFRKRRERRERQALIDSGDLEDPSSPR
ncbi:MAG: DedA family protein [Acidimicrobiales bacterium]